MSALEARGLTLRLGHRRVLDRANLQVERGTSMLLTGSSGSGKSALLRLALGLRPRASDVAVEGSLRLLGEDALRTPTPKLARRTGLVFQDAHHQLTQADVAAELAFRPENLGLAPRDVEARVEEAVRRFALGPMLTRPVATLSGGERKRVALAAVLAAEPEMLLLDEPLGGLDAAWRSALVADLRRELRGRSALVVEHRTHAAQGLCSMRRTLQDGVVVEGAPSRPPRRVRPAAPAESPWPLVLVRGLSVQRGDRTVLRDLDLELAPGVTLLTGANGAGKTTLLRALAGLEAAEGDVRVAGLDPSQVPPHRLGRVLAYVPQHAEALFSCASVRDEVAFAPRHLGLPFGSADVGALASRLGLAHLLDRHPLTLSGGEQQRLGLACALAARPRVLLLDEPTVGLDAAGLAQALGAVDAVRGGVAVLVASHDPDVAAVCDRVLALDRGRVTEARRVEVAA